MIKYAITGNIASGKSSAEKILKSMGYKVLDTDYVAHTLLDESFEEIIKIFKEYDILEENKKEISRTKLGNIVFSDIKLKKQLENIIHPKVKKEIEKFFANNITEDKVFVSIPQLFESDSEKMFDKIILIYANDNIRLKRLIQRNNYTEEYAKLRLKSQISQDKKVEKSDIVIYNNSSIENFEQTITKTFE